MDEVLILREYDRVGFASGEKDLGIDGAAEAQVLDGEGHDVEVLGDLSRQRGRELCIDPDRHAASTG